MPLLKNRVPEIKKTRSERYSGSLPTVDMSDPKLAEFPYHVKFDAAAFAQYLYEFGLEEEDISQLKIVLKNNPKSFVFGQMMKAQQTIMINLGGINSQAQLDLDGVLQKLKTNPSDVKEKDLDVFTSRKLKAYLQNPDIPVSNKQKLLKVVFRSLAARATRRSMAHEATHFVEFKTLPEELRQESRDATLIASVWAGSILALESLFVHAIPDAYSPPLFMIIFYATIRVLYNWLPLEKRARKNEYDPENLQSLASVFTFIKK